MMQPAPDKASAQRKELRSAVIALGILLLIGGYCVWTTFSEGAQMGAFSKVQDSKPPLTQQQVEQLMGQPARIEQSETDDQTIKGLVYFYPHNNSNMKIVFVNGVVFSAEFVPGAKS